MKKHLLHVVLILVCGIFPLKSAAQDTGLLDFNKDWQFTESDSPDYSLTTYQPDDWRKLDLPHDWSIEHDFSKDLEGCTAFLPGGIGWYSKIFDTEIDKNQKCYIIFDGVYNNAEFWINGMRFGSHPFGYAPIYYDLTDYLAPRGEENRISVRVDHSRYADSRWYTGSGIYRNVQLLITNKLHIPVWGTFITSPEISSDEARIEIQLEIKNDNDINKGGSVVSDIFNSKGTRIASAASEFNAEAGQVTVLTQSLKIPDPELWGVETPHLYTANTRIEVAGYILEERETRFGIRTFHFDNENGFFLNGEHMKIRGVCLHHDAGLVGTAVPKDVWKRRLLALKEMGCNAIRSSHNPASDEFLDLCDEMGFLVQNEFYDEWDLPKDKRYNMHDKEVDYITRGHSEHFQLWAEADLKNTMKSGRNHPCIFQWSIGNEIEWTYPGNRGATGIFKETNKDDRMDWTLWRTEIPPHSPQQVRDYWKNFPEQTFYIGETAGKLAQWTREMDPTRPVTANCILPTSSFETGYTDVLDVVGLSYKPHKYDYFKKTYPDKVIMGTENVPRWYEWKAVIERDFIAGLFLWTGVDYMGECRANFWPLKVTPHGPLDLAGFKRGSFYQYQSFWIDEPVIAIYTQTEEKSIFKEAEKGKVVEKRKDYWKLAPREWQDVNPHWNYEEGESVIVEIYSNCDELELFQNGKSLGRQFLVDQEDRIYKWALYFKPGKLLAKGIKGSAKASAVMETAGEAAGIKLIPDRTNMTANNTDVVHVVAQLVDKKGNAVKHVNDQITFNIEGDHRFLGTDCGNSRKITNFKRKTVETEFGKCLLVMQATDAASVLHVSAENGDGSIISEILKIVVENE